MSVYIYSADQLSPRRAQWVGGCCFCRSMSDKALAIVAPGYGNTDGYHVCYVCAHKLVAALLGGER